MNMRLAKGDEIISFLMSVSELEWARNSLSSVSYRTPQGDVLDDRSSEPPYTSFRFKSGQERLLEVIQHAVRDYAGSVEWVLVSHSRDPLPGINWTICPKLTVDIADKVQQSGLTTQQYFREKNPEFGPLAYADMNDFVIFLKQAYAAAESG